MSDPYAILSQIVLTDRSRPAPGATGFEIWTAERYLRAARTPAPVGLCCRYGTCELCDEPEES